MAHRGGHSIYGSAFVDQDTFRRLPGRDWQSVHGKYSHEDKDLIFVSRGCPAGPAAKTRIQAVALVRLGGATRARVVPIAKGEALLALARTALQGGALSPGRLGAELLGALVERTSAFRLELGRESRDVPSCLLSLLSEEGSEP
jgi:hypothetical protein